MNWLIGIWLLVYLLSVILFVLSFRQPNPIQAIFNFSAFLINAFGPSIIIPYMKKLPLNPQIQAENEMIIHLLLTLFSCIILIVWGVVHIRKFMIKGGARGWQINLILLNPAIAIGTLFSAILDPQWFVNVPAYINQKTLTFVWPDTIDAPISYFRITLAAGTAVIPFVTRERN